MSALRKLASQTALYGLTYFAARLLNFFLTPFYTRVFGPAEYGVIAELYAYITFFNVLYTYGMETGYFYFANKDEDSDKVAGTSFLSLLYSSLIFSGLLFLFSPLIAQWLGYTGNHEFIKYLALILVFDTLSVIPFAYLRKHDKAARFALLRFLSIVLNIGLNLFFLVLCPAILKNDSLSAVHPLINTIYKPGFGVGYVLLANVISSAVTLLFLLPELRKIKYTFSTQLWRNIFKYSWPLLILGFAGMINETLDRIILKKLLQKPPMNLSLQEAMYQLGIYSAAYKLSIFMTLAIQSFRYAAEPFFFSQLRDDNNKAIYARVLKYFSFVTAFIFLFVMLYIPLFMRILGPDFRSGDGMAVVPVLLLANLFLGLFIYLSQWYKQTGKTLYGALISVGGAIVTIAINIIFIPYFGFLASAWATFCCYFLMAAASYFLGLKYYPVKYDIGKISLYILASIGFYCISEWVRVEFFKGWTLGVYAINTMLLLSYFLLFLYIEKPNLPVNRLRSKFQRK